MTLLYDELFTCPNCKGTFQSKILGCYNTFGYHYSDLYISSQEEPQPILHQINLCPKCGFAAYTIDFRTFDFEVERVKEAIKQVEKFTEKNATEFNAGDGYLVIANYLRNISHEQKLAILLQASYAYRELKDSNLEKIRKYILETITKILVEREFNQNPEEFYLYLAGEILRLLGKERKALDYYQQTLEKAPKNSVMWNIAYFQLTSPSNIIPNRIFSCKNNYQSNKNS